MTTGVVKWAGYHPGDNNGMGDEGNYIKVEAIVNAETFTFIYMHLSQIGVQVGDTLTQGQVIGETGKTGNAMDPWIIPHVHVQVNNAAGQPIDPVPFFTTPPKHNP